LRFFFAAAAVGFVFFEAAGVLSVSLSHSTAPGVRFDLYSANIDQQLFIVLVFDRRQGLNRIGVVWLYTKRAIQELQSILAN